MCTFTYKNYIYIIYIYMYIYVVNLACMVYNYKFIVSHDVFDYMEMSGKACMAWKWVIAVVL